MFALLKLGAKILSTNFGFFDPYELNFAITYRCNSKCKTCSIWRLKPKDEMTLEEIKKFAKNIGFVHWLRLTGGEPFLRRDYVDVVRVFDKSLGLFILTTPTNGTMPDIVYNDVRDVLKFFHGNYVVSVSLDGPRKVHDRIRGVKCWDRCIETYKKLQTFQNKHKNFKVFFGYTISPYNAGKLEETVNDVNAILPNVGVKDFHVNLFQTSSVYYHNVRKKLKRGYAKKAIRDLELCDRVRATSLEPMNRIELRYLRLAKKYLQSGRTPMNCNIFNLSCFVDPTGNVYPCTIFDRKLGNLRDVGYDLKKILRSKKANEVMKEIVGKRCPHCWTPCEAHQMILSSWLKV